MTFQGKDALRRAESAEGAVRWQIRGERAAVDANIRAEIRARGVDRSARKYDRRQGTVSAAIDYKFDLHRHQFSVFRDCRFVTRARWVTLGRGNHVFGTVVNHLDW